MKIYQLPHINPIWTTLYYPHTDRPVEWFSKMLKALLRRIIKGEILPCSVYIQKGPTKLIFTGFSPFELLYRWRDHSYTKGRTGSRQEEPWEHCERKDDRTSDGDPAAIEEMARDSTWVRATAWWWSLPTSSNKITCYARLARQTACQ